jgi:hypothetical protein
MRIQHKNNKETGNVSPVSAKAKLVEEPEFDLLNDGTNKLESKCEF